MGLPGATNVSVSSQEEAVTVKIGFPVVVKPNDLDRGEGVHAWLTSPEQVALAHQAASKLSKNIIVERYFEGVGHRLHVNAGSVASVYELVPAGVEGDGKRTIRELVMLLQQARLS